MDTREQIWAEAMRAERRGDAAAYGRLLEEVADVLRRLIRGRLARRGMGVHEAEDLVQEVLIGLHTKRHTWDPERPFLPWLHAIVRYKLMDAGRRSRREARYLSDLPIEEWSDLLAAPAEDPDRALVDVDRHVAALPMGQRAVVQALAIEGATVRATAERLGTSEGAIRVTLHRALRRLAAAANLEQAVPIRGKA
ncbi:RNA polymerase sigma factor [Aliidongia dinghuensis]|uniref:RNA polymerase sigma factor n=1 Tax=Aliidongia dinghuensis TaxID=1867774 RepID=A0A8J3E5V8_9PROT|nr:sigma-70 family RNA polymerase sigma factor [Aliidongia dinghuensis]GGF24721.1 RNA polymerase sigma factor [Aliidongia dinghuensis]